MRPLTSAFVLILTASPILAQQPQLAGAASAAKSPVPTTEWSRFEVLGASVISSDGKWVAYELRRNGGLGASALHYRALTGNRDEVASNASGAAFSSNSRWLVYTITDSSAVAARAGGAGGGGGRGGAGAAAAAPAVRNKVGIVDL